MTDLKEHGWSLRREEPRVHEQILSTSHPTHEDGSALREGCDVDVERGL
jgi:hypothetical protein